MSSAKSKTKKRVSYRAEMVISLVTALVWLMISGVWLRNSDKIEDVMAASDLMMKSFGFAMLNLALLAKFVFKISTFMQTPDDERDKMEGFWVAQWGVFKLLALFGYGWFIFQSRGQPILPLVLGCMVYVAIPIVAGAVWSWKARNPY